MNPDREQDGKVVRDLEERGFAAPSPPVEPPGEEEQTASDTANDAADSEDSSAQANGDE